MRSHNLEVFRNRDIDMIIMGVPSDHKHLRLIIKSGNKYLVFQEATIAAIVRAYVNVKTHPLRRAIKMVRCNLIYRKEGYADQQLLEVDIDEEAIINELDRVLES